MTIQPIGAHGAALYCTHADLLARGLSPAALTLEQALSLLREACRPAGLPLGPVAELELFPDHRGVLIFARLRPGRPSRPAPFRPFSRGRVGRHPT